MCIFSNQNFIFGSQNGTISLDPKCIEVMNNFAVPKNVKEVRRFIDMVQFCCRSTYNALPECQMHLRK